MPGKRAENKKFIGWWAPAALRTRFKAFTGSRGITDTEVLNEALSDYLDKNETTQTTGEQQ